MNCPHCGNWSPDCEALPEEQEERRAIACPRCGKAFAIWWRVEHFAEPIEDQWWVCDELIKEAEQAVAEL